jgi:sigma-70-like protein
MKSGLKFHTRICEQSGEKPNLIACGDNACTKGDDDKGRRSAGRKYSHAQETAEIYACSQSGIRTADRAEQPWVYRDYTVALLKHYARMAVESGRLPSLMGRECFRSRVTPYAMASFEDMAIFVHDMETALNRLDDLQQQLITLNVLEEFSQWEIARLLGCTTRWIEWQVSDALDELSGVLVGCGLVRRRTEPDGGEQNCQEQVRGNALRRLDRNYRD